jgi:hypothetical protein
MGTVEVIAQDHDPLLEEGTPMWYSGIDQHKRDSVIATYGPDGRRRGHTEPPSTLAGWLKTSD